jgi:hypothetical protein
MTTAMAAELAMTGSFVTFAVLAWLYLWPWVCKVGAQRALPPLLAVHSFRHVALQLVSAHAFGLPISTAGRDQILYGDLAGMVLALGALVATARHWSGARLLTWAFVAETALRPGQRPRHRSPRVPLRPRTEPVLADLDVLCAPAVGHARRSDRGTRDFAVTRPGTGCASTLSRGRRINAPPTHDTVVFRGLCRGWSARTSLVATLLLVAMWPSSLPAGSETPHRR